jgi:hypothetical protein
MLPKDKRRAILKRTSARPRTDSKYLSAYEISYLFDDDIGTRKEKELQKSIEEKQEGIFYRFQRLINDIAYLDYTGQLDDPGQYWSRIPELKVDMHTLAERTEKKDILSTKEINEVPVRFGYDLGLALRSLLGSAVTNEKSFGLLWGFILAQCATASGQREEENERIESLLCAFNDQKSLHKKYALSHPPPSEDAGLGYADPPTEETVSQQNSALVRTGVLDEYNLEFSSQLDTIVSGYINSLSEQELHKRADRLPEAPNSDISNTDVAESEEKIAYNIISGLLSRGELGAVRDLRIAFDQELDTIGEATASGVQAREIIANIGEFESPSSSDIAVGLYDSSSLTGKVTETLNKLAGENKKGNSRVTSTHEHAPIVAWNQTEGGWDLTAYGELLLEYRDSDRLDWLHRYGTDQGNKSEFLSADEKKRHERISEVIKQLELR